MNNKRIKNAAWIRLDGCNAESCRSSKVIEVILKHMDTVPEVLAHCERHAENLDEDTMYDIGVDMRK